MCNVQCSDVYRDATDDRILTPGDEAPGMGSDVARAGRRVWCTHSGHDLVASLPSLCVEPWTSTRPGCNWCRLGWTLTR
jgi:hypothetical protein